MRRLNVSYRRSAHRSESGDGGEGSRRIARARMAAGAVVVLCVALAGCGAAGTDAQPSESSTPTRTSVSPRPKPTPSPTPTVTLTAAATCGELAELPARERNRAIETVFAPRSEDQRALISVMCALEVPALTPVQVIVDGTAWAGPAVRVPLTVDGGNYNGYTIDASAQIRRVAMTGQEPAARLGYTVLSGGVDGWITITNTTPQRPFPMSSLVAFSIVGSYPPGPLCELGVYRLDDGSCLVYLGSVTPGVSELAAGQAISSVPITPTLRLDVPDASLEVVKTAVDLPSAVALVWGSTMTWGRTNFTTGCKLRNSGAAGSLDSTVMLTAPEGQNARFCF